MMSSAPKRQRLKSLAVLALVLSLLLAGASALAQKDGASQVDPRVNWAKQRVGWKQQGYAFVGNVNSYKFHKIDCRWAKRCYKNCRAKFKTRDEALEAGFEPCKVCKP
jgi:hypothetical protein